MMEQPGLEDNIYLPPNASAQDMGWRWSCTCKPSCSIVRGCGLLHGDIVKIKTAMYINGYLQRVIRDITSISETKTADTMPNDWPALKVGAPHCSGYGILIL
jgi:hypothetical protein